MEVAQSLVLQINGPRSKEFLSKFDYDFEQMAQCLRVRENGQKLVLLNPYFQTIQIQPDFESIDPEQKSFDDEGSLWRNKTASGQRPEPSPLNIHSRFTPTKKLRSQQ